MAFQNRLLRSSSSSSTLKDDSWIRKDDDEYEAVDRDPNFGSSILSQYRSTESLSRFSGSQDDLQTSPYSKTRVTYTQSSPSYKRNDDLESSTTTETTYTTSQNVRKSPTKTFSERVQSFSRGAEDKLYDTLIPSGLKEESVDSPSTLSSSEITTITRSINGTEDELYDTLLPNGISSTSSSSYNTSSVTKREIVTVESSSLPMTSSSSLRSTSRTYIEDIPSTRSTSYIVSSSNLPGDDYSTKSGNYYYSSSSSTSKPSYEYSSITNPTEYTTTTYRRSDDLLSNPLSSAKIVYTSSDRTVHERDLCTSCHKPFNGDAKMVLDDMKISCHAFCFKCEVCNSTLSHLKAGDCMWVYNHMVHCENCFDVTRDKWRH
ncbi:sciellin isoform X2 [Stigmatopora nigra]